MSKKVAFACDHRGFAFKEEIFKILKSKQWEVIDCGTFSADSCDYTDFMFKAADLLGKGECERAIGVCHTGIGSSIAANKVKGVRAALVHWAEEAQLTRAHNDSNMLILGSHFTDSKNLKAIVETWLDTPFEGGRHEQRVNKIKSYEQKYC